MSVHIRVYMNRYTCTGTYILVPSMCLYIYLNMSHGGCSEVGALDRGPYEGTYLRSETLH